MVIDTNKFQFIDGSLSLVINLIKYEESGYLIFSNVYENLKIEILKLKDVYIESKKKFNMFCNVS